MADKRDRIISVYIEDEMKNSYIDYSMSVIVSRAIPDVRDGLKPVHRRILYGMHDLGMRHNRPYRKSARIVGDVLGKYHPHGDSAVYDAMVRMVQQFSLRYPLVDGQGNFGSVDGDSAAAMRYTEARLNLLSEAMLQDLDKDTVDFVPNFDESTQEPSVLPAMLPNMLINGASGIAVGMATNIPPHNLSEIVDALIEIIEHPDIEPEGLLQHVQGPDFPTGGIIYGITGIREALLTGRGRVIVRARASIEKGRAGREAIIVSEIPFQVNKSNLIISIADLVKERKIEGISDLRDESDRDGMRMVIELKRDAQPQVVLNKLYAHTQMQNTFGVIMLALVHGVPKVMGLKPMLEHFVSHRHEMILRRTRFELDKAEKQAHILEGLKIALDHIDEIIQLIKKSKNPEIAKTGLMKTFKLSEIQAKAILEMRLQRLTGLERQKIEEEYLRLIQLIEALRSILENKDKQMALIKEELFEIKEKFGDERRTEIVAKTEEFSVEDFIAEEDMVITISHSGYIKRFPVSGYKRQNRGGKGVIGADTKEEDSIEHLFIASTHHFILFFTDRGKCHWLKVHAIPQIGRGSRGRAIINLLQVEKGESISAVVPVKSFDDDKFLFMSTRLGMTKKTSLTAYSHPKRTGINAITLRPGDQLIDAKLTDGTQDIVLGTSHGKAIRFNESGVRPMGRTASGVRGINLAEDDFLVGMVVARREGNLLAITENGNGKRSAVADYRITGRGGKGIITMKTGERIGNMIAIMDVLDTDDLLIITTKGQVIRQRVQSIKVIGRNTQGVRLIRLNEDDHVADVARVVRQEDAEYE
ncbi:DNA gyrase subunit A [candidate division KSB1 bacterium]|nr:DNA gyrase subunit A [candidate division KSB1 bacterium]